MVIYMFYHIGMLAQDFCILLSCSLALLLSVQSTVKCDPIPNGKIKWILLKHTPVVTSTLRTELVLSFRSSSHGVS